MRAQTSLSMNKRERRSNFINGLNKMSKIKTSTTIEDLFEKAKQQAEGQTHAVRPQTSLAKVIKPIVNVSTFVKKTKRIEEKNKNVKIQKQILDIEKPANINPKEWVIHFVQEKAANSAAIKIQRCWRAYNTRKMWSGIFNRRMWSRKDVMLRIFLGWRGCTTKNFDVLVETYNRFLRLQREKPWLSSKKNISPFPLYYISNRWFYPSSFNSKTFTYVVRVFNRPEARRIFRIWRMMTSSIIGFRQKSGNFMFTVRKRQAFGYSFAAFHLWHRYTMWKKLSKERTDAFSLDLPEFIFEWHGVEKKLNVKKAKRKQADEHYTLMIKKRAILSIHQNLIEIRQFQNDLQSSYNFYLHKLLETGKKAWYKFIDKKKQKKAELLKLQRAWYIIAYDNAKKKNAMNTMTHYKRRWLLTICFGSWRKFTHISLLQAMRSAVLLQKNPSPARQIIFGLMNNKEEIIFEKSFKEWILFTRRRLAFHQFLEYYKKHDEDREIKQIAFYSLKRAADNNIIRRLVHVPARVFPYQVRISIEGTYKDINRFKQQDPDFKFLTSQAPACSNENKLIRLFTLFLDSKKNFGRAKFASNQAPVKSAMIFDVLPFNDIAAEYNKFTESRKIVFRRKLQRDKQIIIGVDSHNFAVRLSSVIQDFKLNPDDSNNLMPDPIKLPKEISFDHNVEQSINEHLEESKKSSFIIQPELHEFVINERRAFKTRMRNPSIIYGNIMNEQTETRGTILLSNKQAAKKETLLSVTSFVKFSKPKEIPFNQPALDCLKDLKTANPDILRKFTLADIKELFCSSTMKKKIENADPFNGIRRFFFTISGIKIDMKPSELPAMSPTIKRRYRRNSAAFVASICGIDTNDSVPLDFEKPEWVNRLVLAINSAFRETRKFQALSQYCGEIPFPAKFAVDSDEAIELRNFVYTLVVNKFPKILKPDASYRKAADNDEFCLQDLNVTIVALPYIFKPELVRDFLKDEMRSKKTGNE